MTRKILLGLLLLGTLLALLNLDRLAYYRAVLTWQAHGIREYEMDEVAVTGMASAIMPSHIRVRDGKVIAVSNPSINIPAAYDDSRTVDGLFASIEWFMNESWLSPGMMQVVAYDPVFGYPTSITVMPRPGVMITDSIWQTTVKNFKVLTGRTVP
jgi:hypothetical protein